MATVNGHTRTKRKIVKGKDPAPRRSRDQLKAPTQEANNKAPKTGQELTDYVRSMIIRNDQTFLKDIAENAGVGSGTVSRLMYGLTRRPSPDTLIGIMAAHDYVVRFEKKQ